MKTNEFAKISKLVTTLLNEYRQVRKECGISDTAWHSRTIERMAAPFIKGHFTLAIVGKVSSGKSTFINALLGCKDLLPTGHDQTTCGITYIEYGEKPEVTITFGDGHKVSINDNISGKIKPHVAIPEKYHNLPVNNIDDLIMKGYGFNAIWDNHERLEAETLCPKIDKSLLKEYVSHRNPKDIAVEVRMKYPFNEELKGWRVIDTPGIGAIGGIEKRTKQLLDNQKDDNTREVDAIIFLQNGSETLDQTDTKKFVKEQLENLSEADKHRLFYVLTHSSGTNFLNHKESKLNFISQNYGEKIKCLTYADSLLYTFLNDLTDSDVDLKEYNQFEQPEGWAEDEWDIIMTVLFQAQQHLRKTKNTFNHDTMLRTLVEWANFDALKSEINEFAKNEKQNSLKQLINLIATDYLGFVKQLAKDKELIDGDLVAINKAIENVEKKRNDYNILARKADEKIKSDEIALRFSFINDELLKFEHLETIELVRTALTNLFDLVQKKEHEEFENIINAFSAFFTEYDSKDIVLESIDFASLEKEAASKSLEDYIISHERTISKCCQADEVIPARWGTRVNEQKQLEEFKALVLKKTRIHRDTFLKQVKKKADNMCKVVSDELDKKLNEEKSRYERLKKQLSRSEEFKAENDAFIASSHKASKNLIKLVEEYGYKI